MLEARAQLGMPIGGLFPQTQQASGFLQYNRISETSPLAGAFSRFTYTQDQVGISVSWELDFWGRFRRTIESADAAWHGTVADYDNALVSLTSDVANSYILIRTIEKRIDIAHQNVETQRESLKIAEARFRYGTTSELDVEQAKTVLNNTLASIPTLETQLRQAKDVISILLGLPPSNLADFLEALQKFLFLRPRWQRGSPPISFAGGRIFGVPSTRPWLNAPRSAWPKRISIPLSRWPECLALVQAMSGIRI